MNLNLRESCDICGCIAPSRVTAAIAAILASEQDRVPSALPLGWMMANFNYGSELNATTVQFVAGVDVFFHCKLCSKG